MSQSSKSSIAQQEQNRRAYQVGVAVALVFVILAVLFGVALAEEPVTLVYCHAQGGEIKDGKCVKHERKQQ